MNVFSNLPIELISNIFSFLQLDIYNCDDIKKINTCSICDKLYIKDKKWCCSIKCENMLLLML
jgi:hypothetical protein